MTTVERGRAAETLAAEHLTARGFDILARNWHNRWCEIDIVARRAQVIHIVEVKYRANTAYGRAAEYISRDKSARLIRAAAAWNQAHSYTGAYQIDVVTVEGDLAHPTIDIIEDITGV